VGPTVLLAVASCPLSGCYPVSTLSSGPASVSGGAAERFAVGAGWFHVERDAKPPVEGARENMVCLCAAMAMGLGAKVELQANFVNVGPGLLLRWQFLGEERLLWRPAGPGVDACVEFGASTGSLADERDKAGSCHLGLTVSVRRGGAVPYLCYRYHFGDWDYNVTGGPQRYSFNHQMLFAGIEIPFGDWSRRSLRVEVFAGEAPGVELSRGEAEFRNSGGSVLYVLDEF
jgi:hypothetical protein